LAGREITTRVKDTRKKKRVGTQGLLTGGQNFRGKDYFGRFLQQKQKGRAFFSQDDWGKRKEKN